MVVVEYVVTNKSIIV